MNKILKKVLGGGVATLLLGAMSMSAATYTLSVGAGPLVYTVGPGDHILGEVIPGLLGSGGQEARDALMINTLLGMSLGQRTAGSSSVPEYYRSLNDFGAINLPTAVTTGAVSASGIADGSATIQIDLPSDTTFKYLVGAYDGKNSGVEVWYIGDIAAGSTILIPRYAQPSPASGQHPENVNPQNLVDGAADSKYLMTGWGLFNPTTHNTPDGSTTITLLGMAMVGLGMIRRRLQK